MKKKLSYIIFAAVILIICAIPSVGFLAAGPSSALANERLAAAPSLREKDGSLNTSFLADLSSYSSGRFFLRRELITAGNAVNAGVFSSSDESSVIVGSSGWLYYADTLADYCGTSPMSERELFASANNLLLMQEYCIANGADFLFVIAPNKNSLYPENMPFYGAVSDMHAASQLLTACTEMGINSSDLFSAFSGEDEVLYFEHDSHWNSKGAALAADLINSSFGKESSYYSDAFSDSEQHTGDLYEMLYPAGSDSETNPVYGKELLYTCSGGNVRADSITINASGSGSGSLLAFRDSFGNLLYPYLAESFASSRFSRATAYDLTLIEALGSDCVLIELVERNLSYLISNIPRMAAPERAPGIPAAEAGSAVLETSSEGAPEGYALCKGTLSLEPDGNSPVYITANGSCYEAFILSGGRFAAYLPSSAKPDGVLVYHEARLVKCPADT